MEIIRDRITGQDLTDRHTTSYSEIVKAVVDLSQGIIAVDAEWHADLESLLIENGSAQKDLWGFNMLPYEPPRYFLKYESLINIRPSDKNFGIQISDPGLQARIKRVVDQLVEYDDVPRVEEPAATYGPVDTTSSGFGGETQYPCFKHHKQLTMEKWRSFKPWQRILMIANEFGRAEVFLETGNVDHLMNCYERALEIFHITVEAGSTESIAAEIISGLLHLRERTAKLLVERRLDPQENQHIREELIKLDPDGYKLFQKPAEVEAPTES